MKGDDYVCNKTSFRKAFRFPWNKDYFLRITNLAKHCHELVIHATHVFKLYYLHHDDFDPFYSDIQTTYSDILYLLNNNYEPESDDKKERVDEMRFTVERYKKLVSTFQQPKITCFQQINTYLSRTMSTNALVNVQEHFVKMARRYIDQVLNVREKSQRLKNDRPSLHSFYARMRKVRAVVLRDQDLDDLLHT